MDLNLNIFEEIIKSFERWRIRGQLKEIRFERFRHKFLNRFFDNPSIEDYIDELDKEEADLRQLLNRL